MIIMGVQTKAEGLAPSRTWNFERRKTGSGKIVQFQDKTFKVTEHATDQCEYDNHIFFAGLGGKDKNYWSKKVKFTCPI